ncbi:MAG: NAD-dependent epimerase/dehydratase family protein [Candidatus Methanofastidiosia archaeon]
MSLRKKALVTGACGFVGTHMTKLLVEKGFRVRATDLADRRFEELGIEFMKADLTEKESLERVLGEVDFIFHTAALFSYSASLEELERVNVLGVKNLYETALDFKVERIIHWSSAEVYGISSKKPLKESAPLRPKHSYGISKLEGEKIALKFFRERALPITILRPTAILGPESTYGAIKPILMLAKGRMPIYPGDPDALSHFVHVEDVTRAALHLSKREDAIGEIYNVADENPLSSKELISFLSKLLKKREPMYLRLSKRLLERIATLFEYYARIFKKEPYLERDTIHLLYENNVFDNTKLKRTGYTFTHPNTLKSLEKILKWYKDRRFF